MYSTYRSSEKMLLTLQQVSILIPLKLCLLILLLVAMNIECIAYIAVFVSSHDDIPGMKPDFLRLLPMFILPSSAIIPSIRSSSPSST